MVQMMFLHATFHYIVSFIRSSIVGSTNIYCYKIQSFEICFGPRNILKRTVIWDYSNGCYLYFLLRTLDIICILYVLMAIRMIMLLHHQIKISFMNMEYNHLEPDYITSKLFNLSLYIKICQIYTLSRIKIM